MHHLGNVGFRQFVGNIFQALPCIRGSSAYLLRRTVQHRRAMLSHHCVSGCSITMPPLCRISAKSSQPHPRPAPVTFLPSPEGFDEESSKRGKRRRKQQNLHTESVYSGCNLVQLLHPLYLAPPHMNKVARKHLDDLMCQETAGEFQVIGLLMQASRSSPLRFVWGCLP